MKNDPETSDSGLLGWVINVIYPLSLAKKQVIASECSVNYLVITIDFVSTGLFLGIYIF